MVTLPRTLPRRTPDAVCFDLGQTVLESLIILTSPLVESLRSIDSTSGGMYTSILVDLEAQQSPVSRRRLARDTAEMVKEPYPNTRLIPNKYSLDGPCLLLNTGTRIVHVSLQFESNYPRTPPTIDIDGQASEDHFESEVRCTDVLEGLNQGKQAYTIKTLAMHLLSMFDGNTELVASRMWFGSGEESRIRSQWRGFTCDKCGHWQSDSKTSGPDADESVAPQPASMYHPSQLKTIENLPDELLKQILEYLPVQDIVRFAQAWEHAEKIVENDAVIHDRGLLCFVTKEHFNLYPLGIGVHLTDDQPGPSTMESEFDLISLAAFRDLWVRTSVYGSKFEHWLPLPLSERHWEQVKDGAYQSLRRLSETKHEPDVMEVLIAFMEDQAVKLFTTEKKSEEISLLQPSEKGIQSLFFLFHLLICVAVDNPEYVDKANKMINYFQAHNARTQDMPGPGRLLAALLISDVETDTNFMPKIFLEALTRNVPALLAKHPELAYLEPDGAASPYRLHHSFTAGQASYRGLMLMFLFQRTVRPSTAGKTLKETRDYLFRRRGSPDSATMAHLAAGLRRIMAVDSFTGCMNYLGVFRDPDERFLAGKLRDAVREAILGRGSVEWRLSQAEELVLRLMSEDMSRLPDTEDLPPSPTGGHWLSESSSGSSDESDFMVFYRRQTSLFISSVVVFSPPVARMPQSSP